MDGVTQLCEKVSKGLGPLQVHVGVHSESVLVTGVKGVVEILHLASVKLAPGIGVGNVS